MCLREYDEKRTMELFKNEWKEEGRQEGRQEGLDEGAKMMGSLMTILYSVGKMDDATRAVEDKEFREKLYKEYGITGSVEKTS